MPVSQMPPVFRFAPSPNGLLHLGHAYSALLNEKMAKDAGGKLLLRIEDVDRQRSRPEFEAGIIDDLNWLGIKFDERPHRQSDHVISYENALNQMIGAGIAYPSTISRSQIAALAVKNVNWPRDPDGALTPPAFEENAGQADGPVAIRLNMAAAIGACKTPPVWHENGQIVSFDANHWGDVVLKSKDGSYAYHLAVVVDDADQGITNVVRGRDLYAATSIHRVLQTLLSLPAPEYFHHDLILDEAGEKLAKSKHSPTLKTLRSQGLSPIQLRNQLGFNA